MAASSSSSLLAALAGLLLLLPLASARPGPCKTLFISYTITSSDPSFPSHPALAFTDSHPLPSFAVFRIIRRPYPASFPANSLRRPTLADRPRHFESDPAVEAISSLQERAKDILFVVVGLLFGVGCGALTAATIYLAWSLLTNRYEVCGYDSEEEEGENPKKMGYVTVAAAPEKEGYEG